MGFADMCARAGVDSKLVKIFPDHHRYSMDDIEQLRSSAKQVGADGFVTTEKDAVKLTSAMMDHLRLIGPVIVAVLEVELLDEASSVDSLVARLNSRVR